MKLSRAEAAKLGIPIHKDEHQHWRNGGPKGKPRLDTGVQHTLFLAACKAHGLPVPVPEYKFHPTRKWAFDWLFEGWLAVEIQGGLFSAGRHVQGAALLKEYKKLNEAVIAGYYVLFFTPEQVQSGEAFATIRRALKDGEP